MYIPFKDTGEGIVYHFYNFHYTHKGIHFLILVQDSDHVIRIETPDGGQLKKVLRI